MASGVATATSKSVQPSWHFLIMSSNPTYSAPAALAASAAGPLLANTSTRTILPLPCGSGTVPRTIWSDCFGSTPSRKARSTVSLNFAFGKLGQHFDGGLQRIRHSRLSTNSSAFLYRLLGIVLAFLYCGASEFVEALPRLVVYLTDDFDPHAPGGSGHHPETPLPREVAFKSFDLSFTMSSTCLRVTLPTFSLFGSSSRR